MKTQLKTLFASILLMLITCFGAFASVGENNALGNFASTQQYLGQNPEAIQLVSLGIFTSSVGSTAECCNATNTGVNVDLPGGVRVNGTQAADDILAPPAPTTRYEVSPAQAEQYLLDMGIPPAQAQSFAQSFDGPIYIREALPGETFGMYSGGPATNPTAQFLTPHTAGSTPAQVVDNLALPPNNPATQLNAATINQPIGVLEGVIAPQSWNGGVSGGGWQVFVPGGSQFGTQPVTIGSQLQ